jgi:SAM-dependent methyltransferase
VARQYAAFLETVVLGQAVLPAAGSMAATPIGESDETPHPGAGERPAPEVGQAVPPAEPSLAATPVGEGGQAPHQRAGENGAPAEAEATPAESRLQPGLAAPQDEQPVAAPESAGESGAGMQAYLRGWAVSDAAARYLDTHRTRLVKTLEITPPGGPEDRILEMGAYLQITPALRSRLGYGEVRGCYYGPAGRIDHRTVTSAGGETFSCDIDHFDAEKDPFPYPEEHFSTVLCCELIEHLFEDPMHLMGEINRILKPGGHLVLTTPNVAALRGISAILQGYHPGFFHAYIKPAADSGEVDARHNREYTAREIHKLLENSGFAVARLETGEFLDLPHPEFGWVMHLLRRYRLETDLRGDGIYAVGRKTGPVRDRYPEWLYS